MSHRLPSRWRLVLGCLGLATLTHAQQPATPATALSQPVQLRPGRRPLGAVLAELARQGHLPFSYSSSLVPLGHRYQVRPGPPRPLGEVLHEVLASEHLTYGLLDGQLVVWPDRVAPPPGITLVSKQVVAARPAIVVAAASSATGVAAGGRYLPVHQSVKIASGPTTKAALTSRAQRLAGGALLASTSSLATAPNSPAGLPRSSASISKSGRASTPTAIRSQVAAAKTAATRPRSITPVRATHPQFVKPPQTVAARPPGVPTDPRTATTAGRRPGQQPPTIYRQAVAALPSRSVALLPLATPTLPATVVAISSPIRSQRDNPPSAPRLRGLYLHAEGWVSESLPLGAVGKIGIPRAYLLLGLAMADNGRQAGPAVGLGLGTSGRARGRFTPNLDVLAWRVGADHDREEAPILLAQLRPQLSWQVRRGGRLALVAGPTLNLATARHRGPQTPRWDFGRDQWLWTNQADAESMLRLWPGVQVGIRF